MQERNFRLIQKPSTDTVELIDMIVDTVSQLFCPATVVQGIN